MHLKVLTYPVSDPFGLFESVQKINKPDDLTKDDCLLLWGGADIDPSLYGQQANRHVYATKHGLTEDLRELEYLKTATILDIPIIGVCRGAQLLTVFTGGYLIQHADGHTQSHTITCYDEGDNLIKVNSSHHQICQPVHPAELLACSTAKVNTVGEYNKVDTLDEVPEAILFPQIRAIGFQWHPEWQDCSQEAKDYCKRAITNYILEK